MGNCLILMKNYDKPRTETYAVTSKGSSIDMGEYNNFRYIDASGVPNVNSTTYTPTSRSASLDMGVANTYRYVNNPSTLWTNTTWVSWGSGKVPIGVDSSDTDFDTVEQTGGSKTISYTPSGTVSQPSFTGMAQDVSTVQPYITYYMWKRTA